jgi:preprotein translocase subunit YajC
MLDAHAQAFHLPAFTLAQATPAAPQANQAPAAPRAVEIPGLPTAGAAPAGPQTAATTAQPAAPAKSASGQPPAGPDMTFLFIITGFMIFLIVMSVMSGRKDKKKREELMNSLAVGDRVQTIGGVLGTIVEIRDDEVALRVDENTNTRIRFSRSAIQQVLRKANAPAAAQAEPKPAAKAAV